MRWSVGKQISSRGAGLGNEVFPWAKAILGKQVFGGTVVDPAWRLSRYGYSSELGGSVIDAAFYNVAVRSPARETMTQEMYEQSGEFNYADALRAAAADGAIRTERAVLRHTSGMLGGYLGIREARNEIRERLFSVPMAAAVMRRVAEFSTEAIIIGIHIRSGDFDPTSRPLVPGVFNVRVPAMWSRTVVHNVAEMADRPIVLALATDDPMLQVDSRAWGSNGPVIRSGGGPAADLAMLAACDLIVPSISSFSLLALFLGESRYVWPREHLWSNEGWLSIWGGEQGIGGSATRLQMRASVDSLAQPRGVPVAADGRVPETLAAELSAGTERQVFRHRSDLIYYGVVRSGE